MKIPSWSLGAIGILALLVNWTVVGYLATKSDPGAVHLWLPFAKYQRIAFGVIAGIGTTLGAAASKGSARGWYAVAGLNAATYLLEFVSS